MPAIAGSFVFSFTITITDHTKGPFSIWDLLSAGNATGVTVVPAAGYGTLQKSVAMVSLQNIGPGNLFGGDKNIKNDGTRQAFKVLPGDPWNAPPRTASATACPIYLPDYYVMADADNTVVNFLVEYA